MYLLGQGETGRSCRPEDRFYTDSFQSCIWVLLRHPDGKQCATHLDWPADVQGFLARERTWFGVPMAELYLYIYHRPAADAAGRVRFGAKALADVLKAAFLAAGGDGRHVGLFAVPEKQYGITSEGFELGASECVLASPFLAKDIADAPRNYQDQTRVRRMKKALEPDCLPLVIFEDGFVQAHHELPASVCGMAGADISAEAQEVALANQYERAWCALLKGGYALQSSEQGVTDAAKPDALLSMWGVFSREAAAFYRGRAVLDVQALVAAYDRHLAILPDSAAGEAIEYDEAWVRPATCGASACCALAFAATTVASAALWCLSLYEPTAP